MAKVMKKRIFCGAVCEQIVYCAPEGAGQDYDSEKVWRSRFKDDAEREKFKTEIAQRRHYRKFQANFSAGDIFATLTFDDDNEVTDFDEARAIRAKWRRLIRKKYPEAVFFIYMGRGRSTHRIHFHMVSHGIPKDWIEKNWSYGRCVRAVVLRRNCRYDGADRGQDYQGLANYLFNHWTKEQGGQRYFATRNARKPEEERATEVHVRHTYSAQRPPRPPKGYRLTVAEGNQYGFLYGTAAGKGRLTEPGKCVTFCDKGGKNGEAVCGHRGKMPALLLGRYEQDLLRGVPGAAMGTSGLAERRRAEKI